METYTARICAILYHPFAVTHDAPSFRRPVIVRVTWRPADAQAQCLVPDWINGANVQAIRDHTERAPTQRWFVRATQYGFRDVELETLKEGERAVLEPIPAPKTRTRGRWYAYECGRWVEKPNHSHGQACYARTREEYWHTPPWEPGADMKPIPPTDEHRRTQKAQP